MHDPLDLPQPQGRGGGRGPAGRGQHRHGESELARGARDELVELLPPVDLGQQLPLAGEGGRQPGHAVAGEGLLGSVPDDLVVACREHDVPLIAVPADVS
ncbi:hypothetical protein C5C82_16010, partial [Rathayibacter sp. AY1D5]